MSAITRASRRELLRGMMGGGAVSVALPLLDCFLNENGTALAATGAPLPVRFGTWFWGCGLNPGRWVPKKLGAGYDTPAEIAVLAPYRDKVNVYSGFKVMTDGKPAVVHYSGSMGILTGSAPKGPLQVSGPTMDTLIADHIGSRTRFRSLEVSAMGNPRDSNSKRSSSIVNPAEISPLNLYTRLFGDGFKDPNAAEFTPDPDVMVRQSVLSAVKDARTSLIQNVGAADKARLDQYFTSVRQLEQQLDLQLRQPEPLEACAVPKAAPQDGPIGVDHTKVTYTHKLFAQLLAQAIACDQTRVINVIFSDAASRLLKAGDSLNHHNLTHEEPIDQTLGYQPRATFFVDRIMEGLGTMVKTLDSIPEAGGTVLDHMILLAHSECSFAKIHSLETIPMFTIGGGAGRLKTGLHIAANAEPVSRVGLTLQQALGLSLHSFGTESMESSKTITEILV